MTRYSQYRIAFGVVLVAAFVSAAGMLLRAEPPQAVGTWASIGATPESRIGGAAVALADGRTLIAGGSIQGTPTDTVVIFNPADGSFASAGQLLAPRVGHTATLLDDGRVLIVGGTVAGLLRNDLELFDPSSGTSEPSATMPQPRSGHAAARLADGTVLIAGGTTTDGVVLQTAEIFDPSTGSTTPTTLPMLMPRTGASATTLIDGRVLIAGGSSNGSADLASAEIYQPWSQLFEAVDTGMSVARSGHAAVLLPWNNSVLIAGGSSDGIPQLTSDLFLPAEFPDPYSYGIGHFGPTGSMAAPRVSAVATPHIEGYAVAMGGGAADAEVYRFATIKTDKDDYAPGVKAIITGSGWQPDTDVTLLFQEDPAVHDDYELHVMSDSAGNITWGQWAPEQHDLNVRFYLMAKQATAVGERRAQTTFTDGADVAVTPATGGSAISAGTAGGTYTSLTGPILTENGAGAINGPGSAPWTLILNAPSGFVFDTGGTAPTVKVTGDSNPSKNINGTTSGGTISLTSVTSTALTLTITAKSTGGTPNILTWQDVRVRPTAASPLASGNITKSGTSTYTLANGSPTTYGALTEVAGAAATTTTVASSANPSTYGNSVTFTATVSSTSTPTGGVSFVIDGGSSVAGTAGTTTGTTAAWTYVTAALNAGTHTVSASYVHSGSFLDSSSLLSGGQGVNKATPTATLAVNNSPQTYTGSGLAATVTISTSSVPGAVANILTGGAATQTTVGTYAVTANFVPTDTTNYNSLIGLAAGNFVIQKATPTATLAVSNSPQTYTGSGLAATVVISASSVPGAVANVLTGGAATQTPAGTYAVTADFVPTDTANYNSLVGLAAGNFAIDKAASTTTTVGDGPFTYDTTTHSGGSGTVTGAGIITGSATVTYSGDQINAGTYYVTAHYAGDANHFGSDGDSVGIDISKAASTTTTVGDGPFVYTGSTQTGGSGTVTGIGGLSTSATSLTYSGDQVNVGTYFVTAHYAGDANHFGSDGNPVGIDITKASSATTTVGAGPFVYTGSTQTGGSGTVSGAGVITGSATVTYSGDQVNVGTYFVTAHYAGDANHFGSDGAAVGIEITKASSATTTVGAGPFVYDTTTHSGGSGTVTGAGVITGSATVTYSGDQVNAGTYYVTAHYAGDANHFGSDGDSVGIDISKAASTTTTVGDGPFVYTGSTQTGGSGTVTGIGGLSTSATSLTYSGDQVNVGTYYVTAHYAGDANHFGSDGDPVGIVISKAASTTATVGDGPFVYTGSTQTGGSGTVTGIGGLSTSATSLTYSGDQVNVGTYFVTAHYAGDANHFGSDGNPVGIDITKASSATTTVGAGPFVYTGSTQTGGSGTVSGAGVITGSATVTYSGDQVNVGTYFVTAHYAGDANHFGSDGNPVGIDITKASSATTTVGAGPFVYDTTTHSGGSGTVTGAGVITGSATVTYSGDQVNAGTYYVTAHYAGDANHFGSDGDSVGIDISKAASTTTTVGDGPFTYDTATHSGGSGTVTGAGVITGSATVTYSGDQVNAGTYYVTAHYVGDANHFGSDGEAVGIVIQKANATVTVSGYTGTYDAAAHGATATITGVVGDPSAAGSSFNPGMSFTNVPGGTASWTFTGGTNYNGQSGTAAIAINKANATVSVTGYTGTYDAVAHGASGTVVGVAGDLLAAGSSLNLGASFTDAPGGTANWSFTGGTNYADQNNTAAIVINKAAATVTVIGYTGTYDAAAHGASGTVVGVAGDLSAAGSSLNLGASFTDAPGGTANWSFTGGTNYADQNNTAAIVINKANATVSVTGYTGTYDAAAHGASGTVVGVAGDLLAAGSSLNLGASFTNVPGGTANWTFTGGTNYNGQSGTAAIVINKANATVNVTPYNVIYDGASHTAVGTAKGVMLETLSGLVLSGTMHVPAGDYLTDPWTFTDVTGNYNNASLTVHDRITYSTGACLGQPGHQILQPINADGASVVKKGSTVPAKFRVCDINGNSVGTPGVVTSFQLIQTTAGTVVNYITEEVLSTTPDSSFRWDSTDKQWIFNVSTKNLSSNVTYKYAITLNDGSVINFQFGTK